MALREVPLRFAIVGRCLVLIVMFALFVPLQMFAQSLHYRPTANNANNKQHVAPYVILESPMWGDFSALRGVWDATSIY